MRLGRSAAVAMSFGVSGMPSKSEPMPRWSGPAMAMTCMKWSMSVAQGWAGDHGGEAAVDAV